MKCNLESFCSALDERLEDFDSKRKGFQVVMVVNLETATTQIIGVRYRKSASDRGLMLNVCPFCCEKILWLPAKKEAPHD